MLCFADAHLSVLQKPGETLVAPAAVLVQHNQLHMVTLVFVPVVSSANRKHEQVSLTYGMHCFGFVSFFFDVKM